MLITYYIYVLTFFGSQVTVLFSATVELVTNEELCTLPYEKAEEIRNYYDYTKVLVNMIGLEVVKSEDEEKLIVVCCVSISESDKIRMKVGLNERGLYFKCCEVKLNEVKL